MTAIGQLTQAAGSFTARCPQWWLIAASLAAWVLSVANAADDAAHVMHRGPAEKMEHWLLMVLAMMLPLVLDSARITAMRSFWHRRHRAMAIFTIGYLGVWAMLGALTLWLPVLPILTAALLLLAAGWQFTPARRRLRAGCQLTIPLSPRGWRADMDCLRFGQMIGTRCVGSCGLLMVACATSGHSMLLMSAATALSIFERIRPMDAKVSAGVMLFGSAAIIIGILPLPTFPG